jgi:hypothetical protein
MSRNLAAGVLLDQKTQQLTWLIANLSDRALSESSPIAPNAIIIPSPHSEADPANKKVSRITPDCDSFGGAANRGMRKADQSSGECGQKGTHATNSTT